MVTTPVDPEQWMLQYQVLRMACPKCGALAHTSTLAGYVLDVNNPGNYKDLNMCECVCGDKHTFHERVPSKEVANIAAYIQEKADSRGWENAEHMAAEKFGDFKTYKAMQWLQLYSS